MCYNFFRVSKNHVHQATLYHKFPDRTVKCLACKQYCRILPGQTGRCGVRKNVAGELQLLVYGKSTGVGIDPMEKKPLFHFLPGREIFSFGTIGCNFKCQFCQNWDTSQARKVTGQDLQPEDIVDYCVEHNIKAIAYTYNEPAIFFEYALDTMKLAKKQGIRNVFVTNGYTSNEALDQMDGLLDAANIDLKSFSDDFYIKICGARLQPVLDTIREYHKRSIWTELTTLVIPGKNDSTSELTKIAGFIAGISPDLPWHISRFTPMYKMLDVKETDKETLVNAYRIGRKAGLNYVYAGNIFDEELQSTYCPKCHKLLIARDWGWIKMVNLKMVKNSTKGKCAYCNTVIAGVWS